MIQRPRGTRLLLEAAHALVAGRVGFREDFDRHVAADAPVACAPDVAHSARTDVRQDLVRSECDPPGNRHVLGNRGSILRHSKNGICAVSGAVGRAKLMGNECYTAAGAAVAFRRCVSMNSGSHVRLMTQEFVPPMPMESLPA